MLNKSVIIENLKDEFKNIEINIHELLDSTNLEAKRLAGNGAEHGTTIFAEAQTQGRGRLGRSFYSPEETGIYMTVLLKAKADMAETVLITTAASAAVCRAIKKVCGDECQIKWVNDIYLNQKKICGILAEAVTDPKAGCIKYIALGIGLNCSVPKDGFPEDLKDKAGSIISSKADDMNTDITSSSASFNGFGFPRNQLAAEIINQVLDIYENIADREFIKEYKERSMVLGREVNVIKHYQAVQNPDISAGMAALVLDIDNDGGLLVEYGDGSRETLNTGEISIRW